MLELFAFITYVVSFALISWSYLCSKKKREPLKKSISLSNLSILTHGCVHRQNNMKHQCNYLYDSVFKTTPLSKKTNKLGENFCYLLYLQYRERTKLPNLYRNHRIQKEEKKTLLEK